MATDASSCKESREILAGLPQAVDRDEARFTTRDLLDCHPPIVKGVDDAHLISARNSELIVERRHERAAHFLEFGRQDGYAAAFALVGEGVDFTLLLVSASVTLTMGEGAGCFPHSWWLREGP